MERIAGQMADLLPRVNSHSRLLQSHLTGPEVTSPARVAACLKNPARPWRSWRISTIFASATLRRAAVGWMPDARLRGRLGGVYFRPLFLNASALSPNQALKKIGFRRLLQNGWLNPLLLIRPAAVRAGAKTISRRTDLSAGRSVSRKFSRRPRGLAQTVQPAGRQICFAFLRRRLQAEGIASGGRGHAADARVRQRHFCCAPVCSRKDEQLARKLEHLRVARPRGNRQSLRYRRRKKNSCSPRATPCCCPTFATRGPAVFCHAPPAPANRSSCRTSFCWLTSCGNTTWDCCLPPAACPGWEKPSGAPRPPAPKKWPVGNTGALAHAKTCSRRAFREQLVAAIEAALAAQK